MFKNKKGQGISINAIIIAAIALIVLVVLVAIFTGKLSDWVGSITGISGDGKKTCSDQLGTFEQQEVCGTKNGIVLNSKDREGGKICCKVRA